MFAPLWRMAESSAGDFRLATIQLETSRQRVAKRPVNRKGTSFTYHQQPMNRITLAHPPSFDSQARTGSGSPRRNTSCTEVRSDPKQTCSVRATPFGGRGVRREDRLLKCWPELQICITQLTREGSPPPGFRTTSGKVATEFQSDSSRTDSPVRILHAQPGSRLKLGGTADWAARHSAYRHFGGEPTPQQDS